VEAIGVDIKARPRVPADTQEPPVFFKGLLWFHRHTNCNLLLISRSPMTISRTCSRRKFKVEKNASLNSSNVNYGSCSIVYLPLK
jgi:hypothetical protein